MQTVRTVDGSSNITTIGYDSATSELRVGFTNGGVFLYEGVSEDIHIAFLRSLSKGSFLAKHIKNQFAGRRTESQFEMSTASEETI